jgi:hypothetical protein
MRGFTLVAVLVVVLLLCGVAFIGLATRQSAQAGAPHMQTRAQAMDREVEEASRVINGQRR